MVIADWNLDIYSLHFRFCNVGSGMWLRVTHIVTCIRLEFHSSMRPKQNRIKWGPEK